MRSIGYKLDAVIKIDEWVTRHTDEAIFYFMAIIGVLLREGKGQPDWRTDVAASI